jgi:mono/diheme cytochrome c family protein
MKGLLALLLLTACCRTALAIEGGDPAAGQAIAQAECAMCHAIGQSDRSPNPASPPFRTLGSKWPVEHLQEALAEGLTVGHSDMPEFIFEEQEIGDLIAFLLAIQEKKP